MYRYLTLILLLFVDVACVFALDLDDCLKLAHQNSINIKIAQKRIDQSKIDLNQSYNDLFLPTLSSSLSNSYSFSRPYDLNREKFNSASTSINIGLSGGINLFNGLKSLNNIDQQQLAIKQAQQNLQLSYESLSLNVIEKYYTIILNLENVKLSDYLIDLTQEQLRQVKILVQSGQQSIDVQYNIESQLAREQTNKVRANNSVKNSLLQMKYLLNIDSLKIEDIELQLNENATLAVKQHLLDKRLAMSPNLKNIQLSQEMNKLSISNVEADYYPSVNLNFSLGSSYSKDLTHNLGDPFMTQVEDRFNQGVSISVGFQIFDRFLRSNSIAKLEIQQSQLELQEWDMKNQVTQRVENIILSIENALEAFHAGEAEAESQTVIYQQNKIRFQENLLSPIEFNINKDRYAISKINLLRLKYQYLMNIEIYRFYMNEESIILE